MANAWFAFYGGDYDRDTSHLTMIQDGAYFRMLRTYYATGQPLPVNSESLVRICGAHSQEEIEAISFILSSFFSLKSDGWHNKRADLEIKEARRISKLRRNARLNKRKSIVPTNDNHLQTQSQSQSHIQKEEQKQKGAARPVFVVPDWIPLENWQGYLQMRQTIKKPMTERAKHFAVRCLDKLRSEGADPAAVLDQSTFNSWQGLFPLRSDSNGTNGRNNQAQPRTNVAVERWQNNRYRAEQELGIMVPETYSDGPGHAPRLSAGSAQLLEPGTKTILGR